MSAKLSETVYGGKNNSEIKRETLVVVSGNRGVLRINGTIRVSVSHGLEANYKMCYCN